MAKLNLGYVTKRTDRIGARLCPLLNAYFMAKRYDADFGFGWSPASGVEPAEVLFSPEFMKAAKPSLIDLPSEDLKIDIKNIYVSNTVSYYRFSDLEKDSTVRINHPFGLYAEIYDSVEAVRENISSLFFSEIVNEDVKKAADEAISFIGSGYSGIHLRRGDLRELFAVDQSPKELFTRFIPNEALDEVSARGSNYVIFTDSVDSIPEKYHERIVTNILPFRIYGHLTEAQRALFEMIVLGAAGKIYAAKSAFSSCSSILGGREIEHPFYTLGVDRYFRSMRSGGGGFFREFSDEQLIGATYFASGEMSKSGDIAAARSISKYMLDEFPQHWKTSLRQGHDAVSERRFEEAANQFRKSLGLRATEEAYAALIRLLVRMGRRDLVESTKQEAVDVLPKSKALESMLAF